MHKLFEYRPMCWICE